MKFPIGSAKTNDKQSLPDRLHGAPIVAEKIAATNGLCDAANKSREIAAKSASAIIDEPTGDLKPIYNLIVNGDLSRLKADQRLTYYNHVCNTLGLNPSTKPLEFITLNGKMVLYALKEASAQLARRDQVSVEVKAINKIIDESVLEVICRASTPDGRITDEVGAVAFGAKLVGEAAANARMRAITKAKRRAVLSHCGLGMLDESELETIPATAMKRGPVEKPAPMQLAEPLSVPGQPMTTLDVQTIPFEPTEDEKIQTNVEIANKLLKEAEIAKQKKAAVAEKMDFYAKPETVNPAMKEGVRHVFDSEKKVEVTTETPAGKPAGDDKDRFDFEDKDHRQGLVKHIKGRFPDLKRGDFVKLGEKYKFAEKWTVIIDDLNRMRDAGKVDFDGY